MNLDERLESLSAGMKTVSDSLEPLMQSTATPTVSQTGESNENAMILRKHATLVADWEAVHEESDVLREELKEDKWLTVFRTVTDQADGMMSSLEKGVNRCQVFTIVLSRGVSLSSSDRNLYGRYTAILKIPMALILLASTNHLRHLRRLPHFWNPLKRRRSAFSLPFVPFVS